MQPDRNGKQRTFEHARSLISKEAPRPGSLLVFPEMFATGFLTRPSQELAENVSPEFPTFRFLQDLAKETSFTVSTILLLTKPLFWRRELKAIPFFGKDFAHSPLSALICDFQKIFGKPAKRAPLFSLSKRNGRRAATRISKRCYGRELLKTNALFSLALEPGAHSRAAALLIRTATNFSSPTTKKKFFPWNSRQTTSSALAKHFRCPFPKFKTTTRYFMELILQIPPQAATNNIPRQMTLVRMGYPDVAIAEARDSILPAEIHFSERDAFPWGDFLQKLAILWQLSRNDSIPKEFQLKKPLPPKIVELIPQIPSNKALEVLKKLGSNGFFSAFSKFNPPAF